MTKNPRENVPPELKYKYRDRHVRYIPKTGAFSAPVLLALRRRFRKKYGMIRGPGIVAKSGFLLGPSELVSLEVIAADYVCLYNTEDVAQCWVLGQLDDWGSGEESEGSRVIPADKRAAVEKYIDTIEDALCEVDPECAAIRGGRAT